MSIPPVKGISSGAVTNIPDQWSAQWFRGFITRYLQPADVRNAQPGFGIDISGTIAQSSQVAVAANVRALFNEPYVLSAAPPDAQLTDYQVLTPQSGVLTLTSAPEALTVGVAVHGIGDTQFRQSVAVSVVGNAGVATANVADIASANTGDVLQNTGSGLAFQPPVLPVQSAGWGTPTGGVVENNFAGGSASLAVTSAALAQVIAALKAAGILGV